MGSFDEYKGTLPYASELFGIYQPLLGWKSAITMARVERARAQVYGELARKALAAAPPSVAVRLHDVHGDHVANPVGAAAFEVTKLEPAQLDPGLTPRVSSTIDSGLARLVLRGLNNRPPDDWSAVVGQDRVQVLLDQLRAIVTDPAKLAADEELEAYVASFAAGYASGDGQRLLTDLFANESHVAGYLVYAAKHMPSTLDDLFFARTGGAVAAAQMADPLLSFGADNFQAILSPIGVIHLYREYFFELDSFLGPPVGHLWLSPGGTVELIEVSSRKTITQTTVEQSTETTTKSETDTTNEDDIADAVKDENRDDIKLGYTSTGSYSAAVWSASASADLSLDRTSSTSREATHKRMREQSEKLSSEIKRNFKSTFKTSTEVTDTSSKRYVIANTTENLVNYELRRKMRKVGVQVQDIGVALCWHTFVDDPARDLGIAKLIHIGEPPQLGDLVQPEAPPMPTAQAQDVSISIPFVGIDTDDTDNEYTDGTETESGGLDSTEHIQPDFPQHVTFTTPGYTLRSVDVSADGSDAQVSVKDLQSADGSSEGSFTIHLDYVAWHDRDTVPTTVHLQWAPSKVTTDSVSAEYQSRLAAYNVEKARRYKEAFYEAARERIKLASEIKPRPSEDLREEERTVVYRALLSQLMSVAPQQSNHVVSELVRSIFDVDKMLYFVAPEWWAPRRHHSSQQLGQDPPPKPPRDFGGLVNVSGMRMARAIAMAPAPGAGSGAASPGSGASGAGAGGPANSITSENIVDWGGANEVGRDSYFITEDSAPARLGSSLGWLLQLDGDNSRNAFLNSPWVKAVIPIRIGKERAALNWLQQAHVEGADGLDDMYVASPDDPPELVSSAGHQVTVRDALDMLIERIQSFDDQARRAVAADPADPGSEDSHYAGSLPTEAVFEHGFYPLAGGVRFDTGPDAPIVFSQWMEIMPTDQVAALQVEYDPKTLQVKEPPA